MIPQAKSPRYFVRSPPVCSSPFDVFCFFSPGRGCPLNLKLSKHRLSGPSAPAPCGAFARLYTSLGRRGAENMPHYSQKPLEDGLVLPDGAAEIDPKRLSCQRTNRWPREAFYFLVQLGVSPWPQNGDRFSVLVFPLASLQERHPEKEWDGPGTESFFLGLVFLGSGLVWLAGWSVCRTWT